MSQNGIDFAASDPSGANLLDVLLPGFQEDVRTNHSGTSRPTYVVAHMTWLDTTTNPWVLKLFNGTDDIVLGTADTSTLKFIPSGPPEIVGDLTPQLGGFLDPNSKYIGRAKGGDLTSASPLVIGTDGDMFNVAGTVNFAAMTVADNRNFVLKFNGALTITHGSGITLPGGANFTTAAGDILTCQSTAANTVLVTNVAKANGTPVVVTETSEAVIEHQSVSGVSTITFNTGIDSSYDYYELRGVNIDQSSSGDMQVRVETGAAIKSGATDYAYCTINNASDSTSPNGTGSTGANSILSAANSGTTQGSSLKITLPDPSSTSSYKPVRFDFDVIGSATVVKQSTTVGFYKSDTGAITGLQLSLTSGTITGDFTLTGKKTS